jgi:hypothetical protein
VAIIAAASAADDCDAIFHQGSGVRGPGSDRHSAAIVARPPTSITKWGTNACRAITMLAAAFFG